MDHVNLEQTTAAPRTLQNRHQPAREEGDVRRIHSFQFICD